MPSPSAHPRRAPIGRAAATAALLAIGLRAQVPASRLREIRIDTGDVFTAAECEGNLFYGLANLLHVVTWRDVVDREVWMRPGDRVDPDEVAELERNLRRMGLFGEVHAALVPAPDGQQDLAIATRDRFSLSVSASAASVGGVQEYSFRLSDSNLLGSGKSLAAVTTRGNDGNSTQLSWFDPQLLGSRHTLEATIGRSDEGRFDRFAVRRPFRRLDDPHSYGVEFAGADREVDFYHRGEATVAVPQQSDAVRLYGALGSGPRELRSALGLDLRLARSRYDAATGPGAGSQRVPGDTDSAEFGPYWTLDWRPRFEKVRRLDALDFDEDLGLGVHGGARLAARYRDERGAGAALQPILAVDARAAMAPARATWLTLAADAALRSDGGQLVGWRTGAAAHAYYLGLPAQTLAASCTFDAVFESQDLQPQLTLGEDNGLRGYPAREFAGQRRIRLNLEDRIDTGVELLSVRLGLAAFADVGWIRDPDAGLDMGTPLRSLGCGIRLGSSHLFGDRVIRIDVAWPLDRVDGEGYGPSLSLAVGQVFTFFGNAEVLGREL